MPIELLSYFHSPLHAVDPAVRQHAGRAHDAGDLRRVRRQRRAARRFFRWAINIALVGLELLVAALQAYVFAILTCLYLQRRPPPALTASPPRKGTSTMDLASAKMIGAGLACIALVGAGVGIGNVFSALISSVARNPASQSQVQPFAFLGFALGRGDRACSVSPSRS